MRPQHWRNSRCSISPSGCQRARDRATRGTNGRDPVPPGWHLLALCLDWRAVGRQLLGYRGAGRSAGDARRPDLGGCARPGVGTGGKSQCHQGQRQPANPVHRRQLAANVLPLFASAATRRRETAVGGCRRSSSRSGWPTAGAAIGTVGSDHQDHAVRRIWPADRDHEHGQGSDQRHPGDNRDHAPVHQGGRAGRRATVHLGHADRHQFHSA